MTRAVVHQTLLRTLEKVDYYQYLGNGYWLVDIELHILLAIL
jgi:hypothetical protein